MENLKEFLPFLIPLVVVELGLLVYTIVHILKHITTNVATAFYGLLLQLSE